MSQNLIGDDINPLKEFNLTLNQLKGSMPVGEIICASATSTLIGIAQNLLAAALKPTWAARARFEKFHLKWESRC